MPKFKNKDGKVFEVSEDHANQVIRKQSKYEEVIPKPKKEAEKKDEQEE